MEFDPALPWYHGSPFELTTLRAGSTVTQKIDLARVFSHKPTLVSISDDGQIKHNGVAPGYLYVISEEIKPNDVMPHPTTTMATGEEWLTRRELHVKLLSAVDILPEEQLSEAEITALMKLLGTSASTPVTRELDRLGIPYRFFCHPGQVHSLEQAARERGQQPDQVVRSIVFRLGEGQFTMVLIAGPAHISWPALRSYLGQSRLTLATEAEVLQATGYPLGAVSPFGLPSPMRVLVDRSVLKQEEISIGSGVRNTTILLRTNDLMTALGDVEIGDFRQHVADEV